MTRLASRLAILAALALAGCDDVPQTWSESDIQTIAYDAAADVAAESPEFSGRIDDLEARIAAQERETEALQAELDAAEAHIDNLYSAYGL